MKDQLIAKWRYANENDENARRLITNDETMCVHEANELREIDPDHALREAAASWAQLWGKDGEQKPDVSVPVQKMTKMGVTNAIAGERIVVEGRQMYEKARKKHKSAQARRMGHGKATTFAHGVFRASCRKMQRDTRVKGRLPQSVG